MRLGLAAWLAAAVICACACSGRAQAEGQPKVIIAIVNQVNWHDLLDEGASAPVLRRLVRDGAVGMMSVRAARGPGSEGGYLTIGAGTRVSARFPPERMGSLEGYAFQVGEIVEGRAAGSLFRAYTGGSAGEKAVAHLGIGEITRQNPPTTYPIHIGLLGGTLRRAGLRVACLGNADTPQSRHREIVAIGMDELGLVPSGDIGADLLRRDPELPYLYTTDPARFGEAFRNALAAADVIVVELGETARAAEYADLMSPPAAAELRRRAIERSDRLLGAMLARLPEGGWTVLILTPTVRQPDPEEQFAGLAPVIWYGPEAPSGLLTSPSTRRPGLVVNTDLAATVLEQYGLPRPTDTVGRAITASPFSGDHATWLGGETGRQDTVETTRRFIFRWLPAQVAIALWAAAFLLLIGERAPRWARMIARALLLVTLAIPATALVMARYPFPALWAAGAIAGGAILLALIGCWLTSWRSAHVTPAILLVGLLVYDVIFGQRMLQWSPLSYSAVAGARFYGIGNEYGGALLGAALIAYAGVLSSRPAAVWWERLGAAVVLFALAGMTGHPRLGANLGMAMACAVGFAVLAMHLWRERPTWRDAALVLWLAFGVVGTAIAVDVFARGAQASHVGMLASQMKVQGWTALWEVIARKSAMNWALLRASPWTDAAAAALTLLVVTVAARPRAALNAMKEREWLSPALTACVIGAAAAFAFNDSGVVAAALALLYGAGALGYVALEETSAA